MTEFDLSAYKNVFDLPKRIVDPYSWVKHIPFAFFLIHILKPRIVVELGVHSGNSFDAFCQAVQRLKTNTKCYGVDSWEGDPHAGYYPEKVYEELLSYHGETYGDFSFLLKCDFDSALSKFSDGSIDLLHIDGMHTYDHVKHDFESWLPKMSEKGVVVFHDTHERNDDFGVWKLWEEASAQYTGFEFKHGHGLGVLIIGEKVDPEFIRFAQAARENTFYEAFFARMGGHVEKIAHLRDKSLRLDQTEDELQISKKIISDRNAQLEKMGAELEKRGLLLKERDAALNRIDKLLAAANAQNQSLNNELERLQSLLHEREARIENLTGHIHVQDVHIQEMHAHQQALESERDQYRQWYERAENDMAVMRATRGWQALEHYRNARRKIDPLIPLAMQLRLNAGKAFHIIKHEGFSSFSHRLKQKIDARKIAHYPLGSSILPPKFIEEEIVFQEETDDMIPMDISVSVVIPTKDAGDEFGEVLARLKRQKGIGRMELIIIDSGSKDKTVETARQLDAKLICIDPESFNHGETRNIGIDAAEGDVILFLTQDALPVNDRLVYEMASVLKQNETAAAVTCRQIPRSDADLFFVWSMQNHYQALHLDRGKVMGCADFDRLSYLEKRSIANLDNVCTLYSTEILKQYRFHRMNFAEDLDLGIRFIKNGLRLAFLPSTAVIHSHNRSPHYCLKRAYADTLSLNQIFDIPVSRMHRDLEAAFRDMVILYERINYMLSGQDEPRDFVLLDQKLKSGRRSDNEMTRDGELRNFISLLRSMASDFSSLSPEMFMDHFSQRLSDFFSFLAHTGTVVDGENKDDFVESVYKIFAGYIGNQLAMFAPGDDGKTHDDFQRVLALLTKGV